MEITDDMFLCNRDWDPSYLKDSFDEDFNDFSSLWESEVMDNDLVSEVNKMEYYCPIVEDISVDNETLTVAVEKIEQE